MELALNFLTCLAKVVQGQFVKIKKKLEMKANADISKLASLLCNVIDNGVG